MHEILLAMSGTWLFYDQLGKGLATLKTLLHHNLLWCALTLGFAIVLSWWPYV